MELTEISKEYIADLIGGGRESLILDIGSYDGRDARELKKILPGSDIHCFEVDPRSADLFRRRNLFTLGTDFHLWTFALGKEDGSVNFYQSDSETRRHYSDQNEWSASSSLKKPKNHLQLFPDVNFKKIISIKVVQLDRFYFQTLYPRIIDFIWCDVNGAEEDVIRGGLNTLMNRTRFLYIEFSDNELYEGQITKDELLRLLPDFEVLEVYNFRGNFGNILLRNKQL